MEDFDIFIKLCNFELFGGRVTNCFVANAIYAQILRSFTSLNSFANRYANTDTPSLCS